MQKLPDLPIYDAYETDKGSSLIALIVAVAMTLLMIAGSAWGLGTHQPVESNGTSMLIFTIGIGFFILLSLGLLRVYVRSRASTQVKQALFQSKAVSTNAKIVGREREDGGEYADSFYIYYQFHPDFIVKALLKGKTAHYYELPEGSVVEIEYVSDKPTQSRLKL